jgi:Tat protein translocase TatB subunit
VTLKSRLRLYFKKNKVSACGAQSRKPFTVVPRDALQSFSPARASNRLAGWRPNVMLLFILDSLGNTELLLILVAALIFFGPRRLPQLSRQLGKSLSEFRRASEDFKRTWEREVNLDNFEKGIEPENSFLDKASDRVRAAREAAAGELNQQPESHVASPAITPIEANSIESHNPAGETEAPATEQPKHEWL